mmetsp:Transcript_13717/g.29487  ORF Transcript_13717/g.29487 Transcript_13717/m.29487 type:complete len:137 (+) Transcript_13717:54-464(+)
MDDEPVQQGLPATMNPLSMIAPAAKRTLSDVLRALPKKGVGCLVARDTWHPESGKYWEITKVEAKKEEGDKFDAWGYKYWKGQRTHKKPKQIASVWKYGWFWKLRSKEQQMFAAELAAFQNTQQSQSNNAQESKSA